MIFCLFWGTQCWLSRLGTLVSG